MHVSYSAIDTYTNKCPFSFKLKYIDKVPLETGNLYAAFGQAIHSVLETCLPDPKVDVDDIFKWLFKKNLKLLPYHKKQEIFTDKKLKKAALNMAKVGANLCKLTIEALENIFPGYELISVEQTFIEPIIEFEANDYEFKGIIDIIIKHNDLYHILDFKNCLWGWNARKKNNTMTTYQLTYYKHYFCLQTNIDLDKVKTYFCLIKRTPTKDNIEIFEVKVGEKKIKNSLKVLNNMLYNIEKKNFPKNKLNCKWCDYYHTQYCDSK